MLDPYSPSALSGILSRDEHGARLCSGHSLRFFAARKLFSNCILSSLPRRCSFHPSIHPLSQCFLLVLKRKQKIPAVNFMWHDILQVTGPCTVNNLEWTDSSLSHTLTHHSLIMFVCKTYMNSIYKGNCLCSYNINPGVSIGYVQDALWTAFMFELHGESGCCYCCCCCCCCFL